MSKAVLIMDMPESCNGCDFEAYNVIDKPICINSNRGTYMAAGTEKKLGGNTARERI